MMAQKIFSQFSFNAAGELSFIDLNGDAIDDLILEEQLTDSAKSLSFRLNNGDGLFTGESPLVEAFTGLLDFETANLNGDAFGDLLVLSSVADSESELLIFFGDSAGPTFFAKRQLAGVSAGLPDLATPFPKLISDWKHTIRLKARFCLR